MEWNLLTLPGFLTRGVLWCHLSPRGLFQKKHGRPETGQQAGHRKGHTALRCVGDPRSVLGVCRPESLEWGCSISGSCTFPQMSPHGFLTQLSASLFCPGPCPSGNPQITQPRSSWCVTGTRAPVTQQQYRVSHSPHRPHP